MPGIGPLKAVIRCRDYAASRAFYTNVLGLVVVEEWDQAEGRGCVVGFGSGTFPPVFLAAGAQVAQQGIPVVLASRATSGRIIITPRKAESGFIVSDDLLPQKARILLMLALATTRDRQAIQEMFYRF